jgi:hypothetical protein
MPLRRIEAVIVRDEQCDYDRLSARRATPTSDSHTIDCRFQYCRARFTMRSTGFEVKGSPAPCIQLALRAARASPIFPIYACTD